jgi:hypothetical protein
MRGFLLVGGGAATFQTAQLEELPPVVSAYLSLAYFPARHHDVSLRTSREMKTLALVADNVLSGRPLEAMDVVFQRLKALEASEASGTWEHAKWLELLPALDVGTVSRAELREAQREQQLEERVRHPGGRAPFPPQPPQHVLSGAATSTTAVSAAAASAAAAAASPATSNLANPKGSGKGSGGPWRKRRR